MVIKLPLADDYVSNWGIDKALRELYQNAIDREQEKENVQMISKYYKDRRMLCVGNQNTKLESKTLVLGSSTKKGNDSMIGSYGEGYKLAFLVLCREGFKVSVRNNNEIWHVYLEYDAFFDSDILHIEIEEIESKNQDLIFIISGLLNLDYEKYKEDNLRLSPPKQKNETKYGDRLAEQKYEKAVFVSGLYVCHVKDKFLYGYNIKPQYIHLDRDRTQVDEYAMASVCSKINAEIANAGAHDTLFDEITKKKSRDVAYIQQHLVDDVKKELSTQIYKSFKKKYGKHAYPIYYYNDESEAKTLKGAVPVEVSHTERELIYQNDEFIKDKKNFEKEDVKTPWQRLEEFKEKYAELFSPKLYDLFESLIMDYAKTWELKD